MRNLFIPFFLIFAIFLRLLSVFISTKHEKQLKADGALEYGQKNTKVLTLASIAFYLSCLLEAVFHKTQWSTLSWIGLGFYIFSMLILFTVIRQLGKLWTVKLIIAPNHKINRHWIFRSFRHPNYFLNIIPEFISIILIAQAWMSALFIFPICLICLLIRIIQEEKVMKPMMSKSDFRSWINFAATIPINENPRFKNDDDLWKKDDESF